MKRIFLFAIVASLAACSAPSTTALVPAASSNAIHVQDSFASSDASGLSPDAKALAIKSIGIIGTINGTYTKGYLPATCHVTDKKGVAVGCTLEAKSTLVIKNLSAYLFTGAKATGCIAAQGKWKGGTVKAGKDVPIVFHWTGKC